jgi:hypothetical protein
MIGGMCRDFIFEAKTNIWSIRDRRRSLSDEERIRLDLSHR